MADTKISALPGATTPLDGTEVFPLVQSSTTKKATVANVQAAPVAAGTANCIQYLNGSKVPSTSSVMQFDGTNFGFGGAASNWNTASYRVFETTTWTIMSESATIGRLLTNYYLDPSYQARYKSNGQAWHQYVYNNYWGLSYATSGTAGNAVTLNDRLSLEGETGNFTLNTGNLVIGTSGKGIDFSADSHAAGMTSQLLNWYEEGTWTPTLLFGGGDNCTYSIQTGDYTRIGRQVTLTCTIALTAVGGATGGATISGFPFTSKASVPTITMFQGDSVTFTGTYPLVYQTGGATSCALFGGSNAATFTQLTNLDFSNTSTLRFVLTYNV